MRKVTELEAMTLSKEHRIAVMSAKSGHESYRIQWAGTAFGIERALQLLGIKFDIEDDGSLSFADIEK